MTRTWLTWLRTRLRRPAAPVVHGIFDSITPMASDHDDAKPVPTIGLLDHYYILGDGHLYARHLFRRDGAHVTLVAIVLDAEAAEKILQALSDG